MAETHQQMLLLTKEDYLPDLNQASLAGWNVIASTRHSSFVRECGGDWMETGETDKAKQVMRDEHIHLSPRSPNARNHRRRKYIIEDQFSWLWLAAGSDDIGHLCWSNRL